ncbi:hypothetical protein L798_02530 [Zootermopsis nevadensis]|uniref:Uncharacterized protein n=1 Tax=Zootermopsis nevadensis TaxID=136037 RepID=A0A067QJN1_ZOONE|nr:hypothetical protein L798_02530 [Zootermopsis nevadensis]
MQKKSELSKIQRFRLCCTKRLNATESDLQRKTSRIFKISRKYCIAMSVAKTKSMAVVVNDNYAGAYEDDRLLGLRAVQSGRSLPAFQRSLLHPSSGRLSQIHN